MNYIIPSQYKDMQLLKPFLVKRIGKPIGLEFQGDKRGCMLKGKITEVSHDGFYFEIDGNSKEVKFYYFTDVASWKHLILDDFLDMK